MAHVVSFFPEIQRLRNQTDLAGVKLNEGRFNLAVSCAKDPEVRRKADFSGKFAVFFRKTCTVVSVA